MNPSLFERAAEKCTSRKPLGTDAGRYRALEAKLELEAPPGFEPGIEVLQTSALPLGDGAGRNCVQGESGRVYAQQHHPSTSLGAS